MCRLCSRRNSDDVLVSKRSFGNSSQSAHQRTQNLSVPSVIIFPLSFSEMGAFKKLSLVLLAVVIGVAMAWIRPAQPKQVEQPAVPNFAKKNHHHALLDNDDIPLENSIHNSRKCKFESFSRIFVSFVIEHVLNATSVAAFLLCMNRWILHWSK